MTGGGSVAGFWRNAFLEVLVLLYLGVGCMVFLWLAVRDQNSPCYSSGFYFFKGVEDAVKVCYP